MQYTLRNVPPEIDAALRRRARREGRSLNEMAIQALREATGMEGEVAEPRRRDLSDVVGSWIAEPAVDEALDEPRRVDPDLWSGDAARRGARRRR
ncbi:MAG: hypothetical protein F9K16_07750 [Thermoanaerobaculia bacterium]|jgi:hypothetical protein|nr:MAG: hypothetical protein F9K16_07750 [Thermoanaerobaculia bacterium]MBZ0103391.1 hypothetical protein [Thermoanaerobaculia bacterium]